MSLLLVNATVRELGTAGVVNGVRQDLLKLLRNSLLHRLRHLRIARGVRDLASLLVGASVVDGVGELVLDGLWDLQDTA